MSAPNTTCPSCPACDDISVTQAALIALGLTVIALQSGYMIHQSCIARRRLHVQTALAISRATTPPSHPVAPIRPVSPIHGSPVTHTSTDEFFDVNDRHDAVRGGIQETDIIRRMPY